MKFCATVFFFAAISLSFTTLSAADEPGWSPYVVARGSQRLEIRNTPLHLRPYRPMHFYGNTIRRNFYRGTPIPMPRDIIRNSGVIGRR